MEAVPEPSPGLSQDFEALAERRFRFSSPVLGPEHVRDIPDVVAKLTQIAHTFRESSTRYRYGLPPRTIVVLVGEGVALRDLAVEAFATELEAEVCDIRPEVGADEGDQLVKTVLLASIEHADRAVLHLSDAGVDLERLAMYGIRPVTQMSADDLFNGFSLLDSLNPWNRTVVVFSVSDIDFLDPSILDHASATLYTDFTAAGAAELLQREALNLGRRSEDTISFDFDAQDTANRLWQAGCQERRLLLTVLEDAVRMKIRGGEDAIDKPVTRGHLLLAWDSWRENHSG